MTTNSEALAIAIRHHQGGQLQTAEQIYRQILERDPKHVDAIHLLGVIAHQVGKHEIAVEYIERAIRLNGTACALHYNLGDAYYALSKFPEATACYRRALKLNPKYAEAHNNLGLALTMQEKHGEAIACLRRALQLKPSFAVGHFNLGNALNCHGKLDDAVASYRRALELKPDFDQAHYNLARALNQQGKLEEAVRSFRRLLELKPDFAEAHSNLGNALWEQGKLDEAIVCNRRALQLNPNLAEGHNNLGNALKDQGKLDEAVACYRRALELKPAYAEVQSNLGNALKKLGQPEDAVACFRQALELKPEFAEAHNNLGSALEGLGNTDEAVACYRRALELQPLYPEANVNLGNACKDQEKLEEAIACYRRALALKPDFAEAHNNLGGAFKDLAMLDEALASYRRAATLRPDWSQFHSNVLYTLHFHQESHPAMLEMEHRQWNLRLAEPLAKSMRPHDNDRNPQRRLRIGYVSPDFRRHAESFFTVPLLSAHDHRHFEIFCYSDVARPDEVTAQLRRHADVWRSITGMTDEQTAECIRRDGIDVLVDLTMHMADNRLLVFVRKPAPIQVTWLAYQGTTGLTVMDYRITDPHIDPPGLDDGHYSEESIRLPDSFWCYDPCTSEATIHPLPALEREHVTFGSFNNFCKVNPFVLKLWAQVLRAVDNSRLVLLAPPGSPRQVVLDALQGDGIDPQRVDFVPRCSRPQYLEYFHRIDVGLDTFPYNGQTTTLDSYWMGVPVVTIRGDLAVARSGMSIARNLGAPEWIADSPEQFVRIAAQLAGNLPGLSALRSSLRERLQRSPLMDAPRFARNMEDAFRAMWQRWCQ